MASVGACPPTDIIYIGYVLAQVNIDRAIRVNIIKSCALTFHPETLSDVAPLVSF